MNHRNVAVLVRPVNDNDGIKALEMEEHIRACEGSANRVCRELYHHDDDGPWEE